MLGTIPLLPGRQVPDAKIGSQIDDPNTRPEQLLGLGHRGGVGSGEKHQVTIPVSIQRRLDEAQIDDAAQVRKQVRVRPSRLGSRGDGFEPRTRVARQQAHQFDTGIAGAANYSYLDHSNVYGESLKWTQNYTRVV